MIRSGDIFANIPHEKAAEQLADLASFPGVRIERIVSNGQASPPGFWYRQDWTEWVLVLSGSAALLIEGESVARRLRAGDWIELPPRLRHRVESTDADAPTVWLAVHIGQPATHPGVGPLADAPPDPR
jgi:cupin 2 domain-containing protein